MIKEVTIHGVFCDRCGEDLQSYKGHPYIPDGYGHHYCYECGVIAGVIKPLEYAQEFVTGSIYSAEFCEGHVVVKQRRGKGFQTIRIEVVDKCGNTVTENT